MNPPVAWALGIGAVAAGAMLWGWRGALLGATVAVFAMLLQFTLALRAVRSAARAPIGRVADVQRFARWLRPGMRLVQLVRTTGSLGEAVSDQPEVWRWSDAQGGQIHVTLVGGRVTTWAVADASHADTPAP